MNIRKVLLSKVLPAILIAALVFHFSLTSTFAFSVGSPSSVDTVITSIPCANASVPSNSLAAITSHITTSYSNVFIATYYSPYDTADIYSFVCEEGSLILWSDHTIYCSTPSATVYASIFSTYSWSGDGSALSVSSSYPSTSITYDGLTYYATDFALNDFLYTNCVCYCSNEFIYDFSVVPPNLDISSYLPDNRYLAADLVERYGSTYIGVTVNDNISDDWDGSYSFVTVSGSSIGIPFTYTFGFGEYLEKQGDPPYAYFFLDPSSIPYDVFTLSSLEYVSSGSFGSLTISVDFTFGDSPIEYNPINNNYYWSSTSYTEYNGGSAWGFDYVKVDTVDGDFWDDNKVLIQPFSFSVMAIPIMPSGITSMDYYVELVNDYLSYYDVILTEVPETTFDNLYGSGAFDDFQHSVSWAHYGNFLMDVSEWYSSHNLIAHPLSYDYYDNLPQYNSSQYCGIAFSDHFYFKQLSYMLGDTSDILTEFSSRFYEEDGFSHTLLQSLSSMYDTEKSFFDNAWYYLERQNYFINDLILNRYIPYSVDLLKDIKELLGDILNALGENAPIDINDLESPLLDIYQFIDALYQGSKTKISDLRLTLKAVSSGILPDGNGGEFYLLPTGNPTPISLPTVPILPALP